MKYKELIIGFLLVLVLGVLQFLLIEWKIPRGVNLSFIFLFSLVKVLYVVILCFRRIVTIAHIDLPYHRFLLFIATNVVLIVFSFSIDYLAVFHLDPTSFTGLEDTTNMFEEYFKLFYLSLLMFTNMGVANVVPVKIPAEALVMFEAIVSFVTLIFILSDYVTLRDSLKRLKEK
ncbi:MAG TPA: hypothetical protein VNB90_04880 [Cytophagaceae bacterium]|nr:hypothetical protein [Cytophagaceae bacterium]